MEEQRRSERLGRRELKDRTRTRLIDAAADVFAAKGFAAATVEDVAEAAGYTKGAVYSNFSSKTDLFLALIDRRIDQQVEVSERALDGVTLEQGMKALAASARGASLDDRTRRWLMLVAEFWLHAMRDDRARRALAEQYERAREYTATMIGTKYAEAGAEPPMPARDIAIVSEALGVGLGLQAALDPAAVPMGLQAEVLRRLLGGGTEAGAATSTGATQATETTSPAATARGAPDRT